MAVLLLGNSNFEMGIPWPELRLPEYMYSVTTKILITQNLKVKISKTAILYAYFRNTGSHVINYIQKKKNLFRL